MLCGHHGTVSRNRRRVGGAAIMALETEEGSVVGIHHGITSVLERGNGGRETRGPAADVAKLHGQRIPLVGHRNPLYLYFYDAL
jgi:hypothetical protein